MRGLLIGGADDCTRGACDPQKSAEDFGEDAELSTRGRMRSPEISNLASGDGNRTKYSGAGVLARRVFSSGAPRTNHTSETRHLAGSIRDVGSAGRRASVSAGLRTYEVGES